MKTGIIIASLVILLLIAGCGQKIEIKIEPKEHPLEPPKTTEEAEELEKPLCNEDGNCDTEEDCSCIDCEGTFECRKEKLGEDEYLLKRGMSEKVAGKTLTFIDLDSSGRTKISVDEKTATLESTKVREVVNRLDVTVLETEYSTEPDKIIVKLLVKEYQPGPDEYLFEQTGSEMIIESVRIKLSYVEKSTPKDFVKIDVGTALNQKIREEETRTIEGLKITLLEAYPKGRPAESYAILKVEKA